MEQWLLWRDETHSPFFNMAADELLQYEAAEQNRVILRFYDWDRPSVSFGYSQSPSAIPRQGYVSVRRPTGGGIVFHDCDLTYTLAIPYGHPIRMLDRMESYQVVHEAVTKGLMTFGLQTLFAPDDMPKHDRATLQCFVSPSPHDIMTADGIDKLAGAAQRRGKLGLLHQGSISLKAACGRGKQALIQAVADGMKERFQAEYIPFTPSRTFLEQAEKLAAEKYETEDWNERKISPPEGIVK